MYIILFIVGALNLALGLVVWFKDKKNPRNIIFLGFAFCVAVWAIGLGIENYVVHYNQIISPFGLLIVNKIFYFAIALTPLFLFLLTYFFHNKFNIKFKHLVFILLAGLIPPVIGIFVPQSVTEDYRFNYSGLDITFASFLILYFAIVIIKIVSELKHSQGIERLRIIYFFLGLVISICFGSITNAIMPTYFNNPSFSSAGPVATIFLVSFTAYAIVRHRFMDVRIVFRGGVIIVLIVVIFSVIIMFFGALASRVFELGFNFYTFLVFLLAALVILFIIRPLKNSLSKIFLRQYYDLSRSIKELPLELEAANTLEKLAIRVANKTEKLFNVDNVYFLVYDKRGNRFVSQLPHLGEIIFRAEDGLVREFIALKESVIRDEIDFLIQKNVEGSAALRNWKKTMKRLKWEAVFPLILGGQILGILALGRKKNKGVYNKGEIESLEDFCSQLTAALASVLLYEDALRGIKKAS